MNVVGVLLIGLGAWLMYEAWRNKTPTPLKTAQKTLQKATGTTTPTAPTGTSPATLS